MPEVLRTVEIGRRLRGKWKGWEVEEISGDEWKRG